ncbi:hypothetical protein [Hymenobacter sp.]|uniref:hypothetical protein n=1 Tax=Hymenobacter sp. TaxID=1898978 RepID=UPI00286B9660|nr:hypothetical protein [Hymenobacter sp.]
MKTALALLLNAALLAVLLPWLGRQWRWAGAGWWRGALVAGLGLRLLVGFITGWQLVRDAQVMSFNGRILTAQMWAEPGAALRTLWGEELHHAGQDLVFYGMSNTFFFIKILAFLNLASLNTDWLNALYLSAFSFVGCWALVRALGQVFPHTPGGAGVVGFLLWPSMVFWASGVTKESVVLGSGAWLLALFIALFFGKPAAPKPVLWGQATSLAVLAVLHFKMRYFFAVPLLGALAALALVQLLQRVGLARRRWAQALVLAVVLGSGAWLASEVSVAFRLNKFTNQVVRIYSRHLGASAGQPHFEYPDLQPTPASILRHVPKAAVNAFARPWLGESRRFLYVAAGLENALLLTLIALALVAVGRGRAGQLPFGVALALGVHCLALAVLLGLSTPNLGSLHRYRSGLLPYAVLLLLQNEYAAAVLRRLGMSKEPGQP